MRSNFEKKLSVRQTSLAYEGSRRKTMLIPRDQKSPSPTMLFGVPMSSKLRAKVELVHRMRLSKEYAYFWMVLIFMYVHCSRGSLSFGKGISSSPASTASIRVSFDPRAFWKCRLNHITTSDRGMNLAVPAGFNDLCRYTYTHSQLLYSVI